MTTVRFWCVLFFLMAAVNVGQVYMALKGEWHFIYMVLTNKRKWAPCWFLLFFIHAYCTDLPPPELMAMIRIPEVTAEILHISDDHSKETWIWVITRERGIDLCGKGYCFEVSGGGGFLICKQSFTLVWSDFTYIESSEVLKTYLGTFILDFQTRSCSLIYIVYNYILYIVLVDFSFGTLYML